METVVGTNTVKDAGYVSYEDAIAVCEKMEYERTHTGSLLFGKFEEIGITSSSLRWPTHYRVFDGLKDNLGVELASKKDKFYQLDVSKFTPTFTKLVVHGYRIDGMRVWVNGEELDAGDAQIGEYSITYQLSQPVQAQLLRFEFPSEEIVELYEIEAFC